MGQPKREKPRRVTGISGGRVERSASASLGMKREDLALFRWSPRAGPSLSTMLRAAARSSGETARVPSSRYTLLKKGCSFYTFRGAGLHVPV